MECATVSRAGAFSRRDGKRGAISGRVGSVGAKHANNALVVMFGISLTLDKTAASFAVVWSGDDARGEGEGDDYGEEFSRHGGGGGWKIL